jgi:hypothetical protein
MTILDTLPVRIRTNRTRPVSSLMLRDPLRAWQAVILPARTGQTSYVRESHLVTHLAKFFYTPETVPRALASRRRLPAFLPNATNEPAMERLVCDGGEC